MLARSLHSATLFMIAGLLPIDAALADSKGGGSGDAKQQCQANALNSYFLAQAQCFNLHQYDYQLDGCMNDAASAYAAALQACNASASLRGGSSAVGSSGGVMRGMTGPSGEGGNMGSRGSNGAHSHNPFGAYNSSNDPRGRPIRPNRPGN